MGVCHIYDRATSRVHMSCVMLKQILGDHWGANVKLHSKKLFRAIVIIICGEPSNRFVWDLVIFHVDHQWSS